MAEKKNKSKKCYNDPEASSSIYKEIPLVVNELVESCKKDTSFDNCNLSSKCFAWIYAISPFDSGCANTPVLMLEISPNLAFKIYN